MTEESKGGWLTPERKKAIVVSLYIWVPIGILSAIAWTFSPPGYAGIRQSYILYLYGTMISIIGPGLLVTVPFILLWAHETKHKSVLMGSAISFMLNTLFGWTQLSGPIFMPVTFFVIPVIICYIYHQKGIVRFTLDGYLASIFFNLVTLFLGYIIGLQLGLFVA